MLPLPLFFRSGQNCKNFALLHYLQHAYAYFAVMNGRVLILSVFLLSAAVVRADKNTELILKVPSLNEASVNRIRIQLSCLEGVRFCGYHVESSCLLLVYNKNTVSDPDIIATLVCALNRKMEVLPLKGYSIYDVIDGKYVRAG